MIRKDVICVLKEFGVVFSVKDNTRKLLTKLRKYMDRNNLTISSERAFSESFKEKFADKIAGSFLESDVKTLLYCNDCLEILPSIPDGSVDMILCDLPYGVTNNKWDSVIDLGLLWLEYGRIIKDSGAIVLTATQPFTSKLVCSNMEMFRYELIWEKTISSGQLNVKHQPLRSHESILVFYKKKPVYNEQKTEGVPYSINRTADYGDGNYRKQRASSKVNDGFRHARSVLKFSNPRIKGGHPTEKPVELLEYLIKTYTNAGDIVLDNCMGCGSTGRACVNLGRRFIGIERDAGYFEKARRKINGEM